MQDLSKIQKRTEHLFLAVAYVCVFTCLVRSDFNFIFALSGYYLFLTRQDDKNLYNNLNAIQFVTLLFDLIWFISVGGMWTATIKGDEQWNSLYGIHFFAIFMSLINVGLKCTLVVYLNKAKELQRGDTVQLNKDQSQSAVSYHPQY